MKYTKTKIKKAFKYRLLVNKKTTEIICKTLLLLPHEMIDFIANHCWFVGSMDDSWGLTLKAKDLNKKDYLIFLSDELLNEPVEQIRFTILHELGHVILKHSNSIGKIQTKKQIKKQEKEADEFAKFYLKNSL